MNDTKRGYWRNGEWKFTVLCAALFVCIPTGLILWFITGNSWWLWLCLPLAMFL